MWYVASLYVWCVHASVLLNAPDVAGSYLASPTFCLAAMAKIGKTGQTEAMSNGGSEIRQNI